MDNMSNSDNSIINCLNKNFQTNAYLVKDNENQYLDNEIMNKEILQNPNLEHKNFIKAIDFGINRNTCGPYVFGVEFNAKFFMNIIREYYLKLNCLRLNLIVNNRIIYIYGHYNQILKIYTKINTHYMHPDMVKIIEGHNKELRAYAKATNDLANQLTHKRSATKKDMLLIVSSTIALINFIGIIEEKF